VLGNEWTDARRTRFVTERFIRPYVLPGSRVLEIGPGGGKFSSILQDQGARLTVADVSREMLTRAHQACDGQPETLLLDGESLQPATDATFDLVFAFDVFLHLESEEIFRYLAEVNRVLKPAGLFIVQTVTLESRFGTEAWLRQLRDHTHLVGQRYGGRIYPMSDGEMQRLAAHSGFEVVQAHGDWEDRDLIYVLRRARPAWPWRFVTVEALYRKVELCERLGGSDRRELYAARLRDSDRLITMLLGAPEDPWLEAAVRARPPEHPSFDPASGSETIAGAHMVHFPYARGFTLSYLRHNPRTLHAPRPYVIRAAVDLLDGVRTAHTAGLVHGELGPECAIVDIDAPRLRIRGLFDPADAGEDAAALRQADRYGLSRIMAFLPLSDPWRARLRNLASSLSPVCAPESTLDQLRDILIDAS
jgi:ubiquinone/menaquinone biosynthesis C-methylase UbiE